MNIMANVFFMADLHLGHKAIGKYRHGVSNVEENTEKLKNNFNTMVSKRDTVYFLGDIAFSWEMLMELKTWNGSKILIAGNHCTDHTTMAQIIDSGVFNGIYALKKYKEFWLSHAPIHPTELRGKTNIHGHVHYQTLEDARYVNVSVDNTDMRPVDLNHIRKVMRMRQNDSYTPSMEVRLQEEINSALGIRGPIERKTTKYSDMIIP